MKYLSLIFIFLLFVVPQILGFYYWFDTLLILYFFNIFGFLPILGTFNWYKHKKTLTNLPFFVKERLPDLQIFIYLYPFMISRELNKGKKVVSILAFCRKRNFHVINIILSKEKEIISILLQ
jgi:hypothetical protein